MSSLNDAEQILGFVSSVSRLQMVHYVTQYADFLSFPFKILYDGASLNVISIALISQVRSNLSGFFTKLVTA